MPIPYIPPYIERRLISPVNAPWRRPPFRLQRPLRRQFVWPPARVEWREGMTDRNYLSYWW